jgi:hypothetical protein
MALIALKLRRNWPNPTQRWRDGNDWSKNEASYWTTLESV